MLLYITLLLACQLAGEMVARLTGLPIPGPLIGMVILFVGLVIKGTIPEGLDKTGGTLLSLLGLLFVPAGSGIVAYLPLVAREWLPITAAIVGGGLVTVAVTGLAMKAMGGGK